MTQPGSAGTIASDAHGVAAWPSSADLFNGYVGASVVFALHQTGVLSAIRREPLDLGQLAAATGIGRDRLRPLVDAAVRLGILWRNDDGIALTAAGAEAVTNAGYFVWALGGYADVFRNLGDWVRGEKEFGADFGRDPVMVAQGSALCDQSFMSPVFLDVLDRLDFGCIADLGCGSGARLMGIAARYPGRTGLGIDISADACAVGRRHVAAAGLADRIRIHHADVTGEVGELEWRERVDLVTSFLLMHDLFAATDPPEALFDRLRQTFPNARRYVLADTNLTPAPVQPPPIHSVAFELLHGVMGVPLRATDEYERIFTRAGLTIAERRSLGVPNTWLYVLEAR